jgi:hypothetical protein
MTRTSMCTFVVQVVQVLSGFSAKFDLYDVLGNNPIHYAASSNAGTAIRFLGQRGRYHRIETFELR